MKHEKIILEEGEQLLFSCDGHHNYIPVVHRVGELKPWYSHPIATLPQVTAELRMFEPDPSNQYWALEMDTFVVFNLGSHTSREAAEDSFDDSRDFFVLDCGEAARVLKSANDLIHLYITPEEFQ